MGTERLKYILLWTLMIVALMAPAISLLSASFTQPADAELANLTVTPSEAEPKEPALLAFYYPWYGTPDVSGYWRHWNEANHNPDNFLDGRRDIAAKHYPLLDVYDSENVSLIKEHIDIAKRADIDAFVVSWWGITTFEDDALSLMKGVCEESNFEFTIYYETTSSLDSTLNDMRYLLDNYANSSSWYRIDNRPVIFIYSRARGQLNPQNVYWDISGSTAYWALSEDVRSPPRYGIFIIHPYGDGVGFVQSDGINLPPNETYTLEVSISDVRNDCHPYSDVGFRIKIENETEGWVTLDNLVVNFNDGWLNLAYDISSFAGQNVSIRVESYAGGVYQWCSEWAAVDYFYIINSKGEIINQDPYIDSGWKTMVENLNESGYNPYFIIDFGGYEGKVQNFSEYFLNFADGMHMYIPCGFTMSDISEIYSEASGAAHSENKIFVATVLPGYDDTEVRSPGYIVERENGSYYASIWETARSSSPDHYIVTSFNEWHEGTEIEPSLEYGYEYIDLTSNYMKGFDISISPDCLGGLPGETLNYTVVVINIGENVDTYDLTISDSENWGATLSENLLENIGPGENGTTTLTVNIPENAPPGVGDEITVTAQSLANPSVSDNASCIVRVASWTGTATFGLENLYAVSLDADLWLGEGSKLVVRFYTYADSYQGENIVWTGTTPDNVSFSKAVPHPQGLHVEKARLDLTTEDTENVISTIATFTVTRSVLMSRLVEIYMEWPFLDEYWPLRDVLNGEITAIYLQWPYAPW